MSRRPVTLARLVQLKFPCCGGNDDPPYEHTMDCSARPDFAPRFIQEVDELDTKSRKRRGLSPEQADQQTAGYFEVIAGPTNKRRDLLSEPSTSAPKKSPPTGRKADYRRAMADMTTYGHQVIKGLWEVAEPRHLVGLYAALHEGLYGVPPLELRQEYGAALSCAKKLCKEEFEDDAAKAVEYLAWCVTRAKRWKADKEHQGEEVVRLAWRVVFHGRKWLTDFKASGRGKR